MPKIIQIIGTRPQFIKLIPELKGTVVVNTGQHYDDNLSDCFITELGLEKPNYNLDTTTLEAMLTALDIVFDDERPDLVIVYGDTRSAYAGAIAAKEWSLKTKLAHIEAGLRNYNRLMPEENYRRIIDSLSDYLFCPNRRFADNLHNEGIDKGIYIVGDVCYDRFLVNRKHNNYVVMTIHRVENLTKDKMNSIMHSIKGYNKVLFPIHPGTKTFIEENSIWTPPNVDFIAPIPYKPMLKLIRNAELVITDSNGVQKEAFWSGTPCEIIRDNNDWTETLDFGDGTAGRKIIKILKEEGFI